MIEAAAEANETLTNKYLEGGQLTDDEIRLGLRLRSIRNEIVLCMLGTAFKNKVSRRYWMRSSSSCPRVEMPPIKGLDDHGETATRTASDDAPFAALAFKILNDPFVGNLTFFRVYSGTLHTTTPCSCRSRRRRSASAGSCRCTRANAPS